MGFEMVKHLIAHCLCSIPETIVSTFKDIQHLVEYTSVTLYKPYLTTLHAFCHGTIRKYVRLNIFVDVPYGVVLRWRHLYHLFSSSSHLNTLSSHAHTETESPKGYFIVKSTGEKHPCSNKIEPFMHLFFYF